MRLELKGLQDRLGFTAIYVTHDQAEALALAETVVVMNRGRIETSGRRAMSSIARVRPLSRASSGSTCWPGELSGADVRGPEGHPYAQVALDDGL